MKPPLFRYTAPTSLEEALAVLAEHGDEVSVLSGGQSLVPLLNMRLARPEVLLDLNRVMGLDGLQRSTESGQPAFHVGALVRARRLELDEQVRAELPVVGVAISHVGHPQVRNRTTIGGNVAHADPSSELPGVLAALDGEVVLTSVRGSRVVGWEEFFVSVFTTSREPDELVTEVRLPVCPEWRFDFVEFARRHGDFPIVALTLGTRIEGGRLTGLRVSATGVGERVVRLGVTEGLIADRPLDASLIDELVASAQAEVDPTADAAGSADYRRSLVGTLLRRCLVELQPADAA